MHSFFTGSVRYAMGLMFAGLVMLPALAGAFELPSGVFKYSELQEARKAAYEDKKPLLLLYTDPKLKPS